MRFAIERRNFFSLIMSILVMASLSFASAPAYAMASGARVISQGKQANPAWKGCIHLATVLCTAGKGWVTANLDGSVSTTGDYISWGTGAGTAAVGDTTLFTEDSGGSPTYARVSATRTIQTTSVTNDTLRWIGTITSNGTKTITNAGNFTASTSGTMIVKSDLASSVSLLVNDSIQFTITLQVT